MAIDFERQLREIASRAKRAVEAFLVQMNPRVSAKFTGDQARVLHSLEQETGKVFHFEGSEGLPLDHFAITMEGTREEIEERAIPFKEGDEVLVNIIEPHMYEVDDAVAKIDGYIISVVDGGRHVGQKKLVRIEEAGRTAAVATLLDGDDGEAADGDEALDSKPRRRGRRGGRRRSAVKAEATSE
jgi:ribonuclease G